MYESDSCHVCFRDVLTSDTTITQSSKPGHLIIHNRVYSRATTKLPATTTSDIETATGAYVVLTGATATNTLLMSTVEGGIDYYRAPFFSVV